jgi:HK97 family phage prohead protease
VPNLIRLAGYASIFGVPGSSGDIVVRGAFARAAIAGPVPWLWQHAVDTPIGRVEKLGEDARGLRVIAAIVADTEQGHDAALLLCAGAISGLSFGYRVRASRPDRTRGVRELTDLDLLEVSIVTFPMQPLARVIAIDLDLPH